MAKDKKNKPYFFSDTLSVLLDDSTPLSPLYLKGFHSLSKKDSEMFAAAYPKISFERKVDLFNGLADLYEKDNLVKFIEVGRVGLKDPEPFIRKSALFLMVECRDLRFSKALQTIVESDPITELRTFAINVLGLFVMDHVFDEIPEKIGKDLIAFLTPYLKDPDDQISLSAMEALSYLDTEEISGLIGVALKDGREAHVISALKAIRNSINSEWEDEVIGLIGSENAAIKNLAIQTAGAIKSVSSLEPLFDMIADYGSLDMTTLKCAIWSISEIASPICEEVLDALEEVVEKESSSCADEEEDEDEDEEGEGELIDFIRDAVDNLSLHLMLQRRFTFGERYNSILGNDWLNNIEDDDDDESDLAEDFGESDQNEDDESDLGEDYGESDPDEDDESDLGEDFGESDPDEDFDESVLEARDRCITALQKKLDYLFEIFGDEDEDEYLDDEEDDDDEDDDDLFNKLLDLSKFRIIDDPEADSIFDEDEDEYLDDEDEDEDEDEYLDDEEDINS